MRKWNFLAVSEAHKAMLWLSSCLKEGNLNSCQGFSAKTETYSGRRGHFGRKSLLISKVEWWQVACILVSVSTRWTPAMYSHPLVTLRWLRVQDATVTERVTSPGPRLPPPPGDFSLPSATVCLPGLVSTRSHHEFPVTMSHQGISDCCLWLSARLDWWVRVDTRSHQSPWVTRTTMSHRGRHESSGDFRLSPVTVCLDWWVHVVTTSQQDHHESQTYFRLPPVTICLPGLVSSHCVVTTSHQGI